MRPLLCALTVAYLTHLPSAHAVLTVLGNTGFTTTGTVLAEASPYPGKLNDLDQHLMYSWQIDNLSDVPDAKWATLTFANIYNADENPNKLFIWLFDKAKFNSSSLPSSTSGVTWLGSNITSFVDAPIGNAPVPLLGNLSRPAGFVDGPGANAPVQPIIDDFGTPGARGYQRLATGGIKLDERSFAGPSQPSTWTYVFDPAEVEQLNKYLDKNKNIAFGFDSDSHYFNDGVTFRMGTGSLSAMPEGSTLVPLIGIMALAGGAQVMRRRRVITNVVVSAPENSASPA